jgi:hypothetical protein
VGPENSGSKRGRRAREGPGITSVWCIDGRINVQPSLPLVRASSPHLGLVVHSSAYSRNAEIVHLQGKMRENGQRGACHHGVGVTSDRRLRVEEILHWGRYRLGLLSVTFSFH